MFVIVAVPLLFEPPAYSQGRGQRGGPPPSPKAAAAFDPTGYWVSIITEDWHVRMVTPPKGDFGSGTNTEGLPFGGGGNIPYNDEGTKLAKAWDAAKDEREGNQCKAYGAPGIMRQPTRLHITWQDDNTLRIDSDAGMQTRIFHFAQPGTDGPMTAPANQQPSMQGYSVAQWEIFGGQSWPRGGNLKVVTTHLAPGYYWKNGMPYSDKATMTEHFRLSKEPNGDNWLNFSLMMEDPVYLTEPWIVTYSFKREPDATKWDPQPCFIQ